MTAGTAIKRVTRNQLVKRLLWSALQAGIGALASQASARLARWIWRRVFDETPPDH
jgi:stress-induced morphogen